MGFNSKEVLIANTQVWYKRTWTQSFRLASSLAANPPRHSARARAAGPLGETLLHAPHCTAEGGQSSLPRCLPNRKGWEQCRSQGDPPCCREGNLLRVFMLWKHVRFPPHYPTAVVPGTYSVQSHRLVFLKLSLGKSLCSTRLPQRARVLFLIHLEVICLLHLLSPHSQDYSCCLVLFFPRPKTEIHFGRTLQPQRVLPARKETALPFMHAERTGFSALEVN